MNCNSCGNEVTIPIGPIGPAGPAGPIGPDYTYYTVDHTSASVNGEVWFQQVGGTGPVYLYINVLGVYYSVAMTT